MWEGDGVDIILVDDDEALYLHSSSLFSTSFVPSCSLILRPMLFSASPSPAHSTRLPMVPLRDFSTSSVCCIEESSFFWMVPSNMAARCTTHREVTFPLFFSFAALDSAGAAPSVFWFVASPASSLTDADSILFPFTSISGNTNCFCSISMNMAARCSTRESVFFLLFPVPIDGLSIVSSASVSPVSFSMISSVALSSSSLLPLPLPLSLPLPLLLRPFNSSDLRRPPWPSSSRCFLVCATNDSYRLTVPMDPDERRAFVPSFPVDGSRMVIFDSQLVN
mmetsp:Transcript_29945/g.61631  ORF Transcript_29945/g.61631 Transcript_29945/m.61631 type:complete len:279 (+) Transcript_29945:205-1041(+)